MVSKGKINKFLEKIHLPHWLTILLAIVLILRIPSFFEPFSYGDEMIYLTLGEAVRQGKTLYLFAHDNKPPLLYLIAAIAGNVFWFKVILAGWMLATTVIFWRFVQALFPKKEKLQKIATVIFAIFTTIPLLEGHIANAELFMIGPTMLAFYILLSKKLSFKNVFVSGMLLSASSLFKIPAAFDIPAIVFFWLIIGGLKFKSIKETIKNTAVLFVGYALPIGFTFIWYWSKGAFNEYLVGAFLQNVGYLSSFRPGDIREPFLVRNAPLLTRAGLVGVGILAVSVFRKKLSKQFIFLTIWLLLTLFAVTLSERPYPHYLIQSLPAASIMAAMLFSLRTIEQTLVVLPLTAMLFVPIYFNYWHYKTLPYYERFIKFSTGSITKSEYLNSFGGHIEPSYEIADFISISTERHDPVFVWGPDSSLIYALSRRLPPIKYVAQYHISDFSNSEEVLESLENTNPKLIILLPNSPEFGDIIPFLRKNYILVQEVDGAEIWSLVSPDVRSQIAP